MLAETLKYLFHLDSTTTSSVIYVRLLGESHTQNAQIGTVLVSFWSTLTDNGVNIVLLITDRRISELSINLRSTCDDAQKENLSRT